MVVADRARGYKGKAWTGRSAAWLARLLGVQEVVGSNPAGPTFFRNKPFGEHVEGLFGFNCLRLRMSDPVQTIGNFARVFFGYCRNALSQLDIQRFKLT